MSTFEKKVYGAFQIAIARKLRACFGAVIALAFLLVSPASSAYTLDTSASPSPISGLWWNQNESGWGANLIQQYDVIFVTMFTYDGAGNPTWYVASDCAVTGGGCQGYLYEVTGGSMPTETWNGNNKVVIPVGTISLAFADNDNGTMNYTINGAPGSKAITRQVWRTIPPHTADRSCSGGMTGFTFSLIIHPSAGTISVSMTGTTNTSLFAPWYVSLIQGSNSVTGTYSTSIPGVWWTGDAGFKSGVVPTGVTKSGTFSGFPSWFNFSQPFTVSSNITGEQFTCY